MHLRRAEDATETLPSIASRFEQVYQESEVLLKQLATNPRSKNLSFHYHLKSDLGNKTKKKQIKRHKQSILGGASVCLLHIVKHSYSNTTAKANFGAR